MNSFTGEFSAPTRTRCFSSGAASISMALPNPTINRTTIITNCLIFILSLNDSLISCIITSTFDSSKIKFIITNKTVINRLSVLAKNGFVVPNMVNERIRSYELSDFTRSNEKEIVKSINL